MVTRKAKKRGPQDATVKKYISPLRRDVKVLQKQVRQLSKAIARLEVITAQYGPGRKRSR